MIMMMLISFFFSLSLSLSLLLIVWLSTKMHLTVECVLEEDLRRFSSPFDVLETNERETEEKDVDSSRIAWEIRMHRIDLFFDYFKRQDAPDASLSSLPFLVPSSLTLVRSVLSTHGVKVRRLLETFLLAHTKNLSAMRYGPKMRQRGLLLYGPPGTGKTEIMNTFEWFGFVVVFPKFSAGMISDKHVGETEAMLMRMFDMAKEFPWLPCCVFIDEIESLVPNRSASSSQDYKSDGLSVLLGRFGGIDDVANIFLIASTNHIDRKSVV